MSSETVEDRGLPHREERKRILERALAAQEAARTLLERLELAERRRSGDEALRRLEPLPGAPGWNTGAYGGGIVGAASGLGMDGAGAREAA
jgi:hypothetical protein